MATDTDRALSLIKEKVELLTGERANGNRRAVLISELDAFLRLVNDKTITLGNKIESDKQELSEEFWKTLAEEVQKISVEIDEAVEKAREDFEKSIIEARSAIETTRQASQAARLEARNAFQDAQTSIIRLREQSDNAFAELAEIVETILEVRSDVDGNSAAITIEAGARATADSALSGQITTITAQVGSNSAAIVEQEVARVDLESALSATNSALSASFNDNKALIEQEAITRATADDATSVLTSTLQATVGSNSAAITQQEIATTTLESALAATGATLSVSFNNNKAQIEQESITRASADTALSGQVTTINAQVGSNTATITQQEVALVDLESSISATNSTLSASFNDNKAQIEQEAITRATADNATSVLTGSLQSAVGSNSAAILAEQVTRANSDSAITAQFTSLQATVNNNKALFDDEVVTRASEDSALSGRITTLKASYDTQVGDTKTFGVHARGFSATASGTAGLYVNSTTATPTFGASRSYNLYVINRSTGEVTENLSYDVFSSASNATSLANKLNSLNSTQLVVISTFDEPKANRLTGGLPAAIRRCGGTRTVFGDETAGATDNWKIRCAYILVGIPGEGEGTGVEKYAGSVDSDTNSAIWYSFTVRNGFLNGVSGTGLLSAALVTEQLTRATADGAVATAITTATAGMNRGRVFQQTVAPTSVGRQVGDIWYDTDDSYRPYYWTGTAWVDNTSGTYKVGAIASIEQSMTAINDAVQWGIQGTIDGQPAGSIALTGWKSPTTGEVRSRLKINSNVEIDGSLLVTGSITGDRISTTDGVNTDNVVTNAITEGSFGEGQGSASCNLIAKKAGDRFIIIGSYQGGKTSNTNFGFGFALGTTIAGNMVFNVNNAWDFLTVPIRGFAYSVTQPFAALGNPGIEVNYMTSPTCFAASITSGGPGLHTFYIRMSSGLTEYTTVTVIRLSK